MTKNVPYAFLSYAKEDAEQVRRFRSRLRKDGYEVWLDEHNLLPGQDWDAAIQKAIQDSRVFILCLSSNAVSKRGYIQKEIRKALEVAQHFPAHDVFIIPVRLSECEIPEALAKWQWIDLFRKRGYTRVRAAIGSRLRLAKRAATKRVKNPAFGRATDHFIYELCLGAGHLIYGRLGAKRFFIGQGHFLVTREDMPKEFLALRGQIPDVRELGAGVARRFFSKNTPWRKARNRVTDVRLLPTWDAVELRSTKGTAHVNAKYWSLAMLLAKAPTAYIDKSGGTVHIRGIDGTQFVVASLRLETF